MKLLLLTLSAAATFCSNAFATEWLADVPTAMARAQKEGKAVLLDFTGSDWCGWCQKLKAEVFDTFEFGAYAAANLVLVEVDFPQRKKISMDQLNANYALASKYGVKGYPTIIVLNSDGRLLGESGYLEGGPVAFVGNLEKFPGMPLKGRYLVSNPAAPSTNSAGGPRLISVRPSIQSAAPPVQANPPPPPQYGAPTLKGISGAGNRRLALINNEPMMVGESASIKSFGTNIEVTVKEIRERSVVILVAGQTRELSIAGAHGKP